MKRCPHCGASNPNTALICGDCGHDFAAVPSTLPPPSPPPSRATPQPSIATVQSVPRTFLSRLDLMLVLPWSANRQAWLPWLHHLVSSAPVRVGVVRYGGSGDPLVCTDTGGEVFSREGWRWQEHNSPIPAAVRSFDALSLALAQPYRAPIKAILAVLEQPPISPDQQTPSLEHIIQGLARLQRLYLGLPLGDPEGFGGSLPPPLTYLRLLEGTRALALNLGSPTWLEEVSAMVIHLATDAG